MQATRNLVRILVKLTAGVQLRHNHFSRRNALFRVNVDGNAATVVLYRNRMIFVQNHQRAVTVPGQRFIDGVIDHFIHHVMQARAVVRIANIHTGALAHSIQSTEDFDAIGAVFVLLLFCHGFPLLSASPSGFATGSLGLLIYAPIMD